MKSDPASALPWWHADASDDALAAFHDAFADLHDAAPWRHVPDSRCRLFISAPDVGQVSDLVIVTGQDGHEPGLRLFSDLPTHETWLAQEGARDRQAGRLPGLYISLDFLREADVAESVREAVERHGWRVACSNAWPVMRLIFPDGRNERPLDGSLARLEACARALSAALAEPTPWQRAWRDGSVHETSSTIDTSMDDQIDLLVTSETPVWMTLFEGTDNELLEAFELLDWSDGLERVDMDRLAELERTLIHRILTSAPALIPQHQHAGIHLLLDYCSGAFEIPITKMTAAQLESIVFEAVPERVAVPPSDASIVLDTLRGTLRWLSERRPLEHGDACMSLLESADTASRLAELLAKPDLFSEHKQEFMDGLEAGFDMNTEVGYEAYLTQWRREKLSSMMHGEFDPSIDADGIGLPRPLSPGQRKKRKSKRKAARKARKKNR